MWQKVWDAERLLERFDWLWILDADAAIMNGDVSVRSIIDRYATSQSTNVLIGADDSTINTGSMLLRKSHWTISLLRLIQSYASNAEFLKADKTLLRDQTALVDILFYNYLNATDHIKIIPRKYINSYTWDHLVKNDCSNFVMLNVLLKSFSSFEHQGVEYRKGDFILHGLGQAHETWRHYELYKYMTRRNLTEF